MADNIFGKLISYIAQNPAAGSTAAFVNTPQSTGNKVSAHSTGGGSNTASSSSAQTSQPSNTSTGLGSGYQPGQSDYSKYGYQGDTKTGNYKDDSSSGGGSGKGSSGSAGVSSDYLNSLYAQRQGMAQNAYDSALERLGAAYNKAAQSYADIYGRGVDTLRGAYDNSQNRINDDARRSLQEAYINKMLSQKNLAQQLAAQGISGGASESAVAGLINNYGNSRNGITRDWNNNLSDLEQTYNTNLNDLYSAYQNQMAALENNRANAMNTLEFNLANMLMDSMPSISEYISAMGNTGDLSNAVSKAIASQGAYTPTETQATNTVNPVNTTQKTDMGDNATNWMKWLEDQYRLGRTSNAATLEMASPKNNVSPEDIAYYLSNSSYYR